MKTIIYQEQEGLIFKQPAYEYWPIWSLYVNNIICDYIKAHARAPSLVHIMTCITCKFCSVILMARQLYMPADTRDVTSGNALRERDITGSVDWCIDRGLWKFVYICLDHPIIDIHIWLFLRPWWRYQTETFSALLVICAGNSPVADEFPPPPHTQRSVTPSFDAFFDLRLNKRVSKQWWGWWFETSSRPLWRHCNAMLIW